MHSTPMSIGTDKKPGQRVAGVCSTQLNLKLARVKCVQEMISILLWNRSLCPALSLTDAQSVFRGFFYCLLWLKTAMRAVRVSQNKLRTTKNQINELKDGQPQHKETTELDDNSLLWVCHTVY